MNDEENKKIGKIDQTRKSKSVSQVDSVGEIDRVKKADAVKGVKQTSQTAATSQTRAMTMAEREKLLTMVDDEAKKLFGNSKIPAKQKAIIEQAVKMAIDAAIVEEKN